MTLDNQTLGILFSELENEFLQDPDITIIPVSGDPPNEYEITFHIPCTTINEQGNIEITSDHVIGMSIPFGFPHFPPSCKPKSPIFHPDFDNAAICLGDFWNKTPSIPKLIRQLKSMIGGEIYSTENAFNETAAAWFRDNKGKLPFTRHGDSGLFHSVESDLENPDQELSIVKESDLADDFSLEDDSFELQPIPSTIELAAPADDKQAQPEPYIPSDFDLERFNLLDSKRHFQELDAELSALPDGADSDEIKQLAKIASKAMERASTLHQKALRLQQQGDLRQALDCFHSVEDYVADFPNILEKISSLEKLLDDQPASQLKGISEQKGVTEVDSVTGQKVSDGSTAKNSAPSPSANIAVPEKAKRKKNRTFLKPRLGKPLLYGLAGLALIGAAAGGYLVFHDSNKLDASRALLAQCKTAVHQQQFRAAQNACLEAQQASDSVIFLHQPEIAIVQQQVRSILQSQALQQGLKGNVLFNGTYVPKSQVAQHQELLEVLAAGSSAFEQSKWLEANTNLARAIELNSTLKSLSEEQLGKLTEQAAYAAFLLKLEAAEKILAEENGSIDMAALTSLKNELDTLSAESAAPLRSRVEVILTKYQFSALKQQADALFSQSDWPGAMSLFAKAAETGKLLSETEPPELSDIRKNIIRAELYSSIDAGNRLFADGKWDNAISQYDKAISILKGNYQILNEGGYRHSIEKLERVILQSTIIRDRQLAEMLRNDNKLGEAERKLQEIVANITRSAYSTDAEFLEILAETRETAIEVRRKAFIEERNSYLVKNFYSLINQNYTAASEDNLSSPSAEFVKQLDASHYLFKLQCTETGRGRPLKLVMYYSYNSESDSWEFSNKNSSL